MIAGMPSLGRLTEGHIAGPSVDPDHPVVARNGNHFPSRHKKNCHRQNDGPSEYRDGRAHDLNIAWQVHSAKRAGIGS